jgi:hypothetical protein
MPQWLDFSYTVGLYYIKEFNICDSIYRLSATTIFGLPMPGR